MDNRKYETFKMYTDILDQEVLVTPAVNRGLKGDLLYDVLKKYSVYTPKPDGLNIIDYANLNTYMIINSDTDGKGLKFIVTINLWSDGSGTGPQHINVLDSRTHFDMFRYIDTKREPL